MDEAWTFERLSRALFRAWELTAQGGHSDVAGEVPVPGDVGLRGRFHYLADVDAHADIPPAAFEVTWQRWSEQLQATAEGDAALTSQDIDAARSAFHKLLALQEPGRSLVPTVDALVGLADAERQADDVDAAIRYAEQSLQHAEDIGYLFGQIRALTTLGYLTLRAGSAERAHNVFDRARGLSEQIDERLYAANASAGSGEALARLGRFDDSKTALRKAGSQFAQLGDVHRRLREVEPAIAALTRARDASEQAGLVIGAVNASDALGEVHLANGDLDAAVAAHRNAFQVSDEHGYRRGRAHALNGLARCAFSVKECGLATDLFAAAAKIFAELDDPVSVAGSLTGQARCAEEAGDPDGHLAFRLAAVAAVESIRFAQPRHADQVEYSQRFSEVYWHAFRAAIGVQDATAFLAVFEAVAGRRLAAMLASVPRNPAEAALLGQLLARANTRPFDGSDLSDPTDRHTRRARLLGRLGLRGALPDRVEQALDDAVTALVRPFDPATAAAVLGALPAVAHVLLLAHAPGRADRIVWCWRAPSGRVRLGFADVAEDTRLLVSRIATHGVDADSTPASVAPLAALLPDEVRSGLDADGRLLLVPIGDLWSVPWPAVPLNSTGQLLGEAVAFTVAPSASVAAALPAQSRLPDGARVSWWTGPNVMHQALRAYDGDPRVTVRPLDSPEQAQVAVTGGDDDLVVVFAHGRPAQGIGHFLELGAEQPLTPLDLLSGQTPAQLALVSCWGARTPSTAPGDPLTLATIALVRGTRTVLATNAELADDPASAAFVNDVLHFMLDRPPAVAVRDATKRRLTRPGARLEAIMMWAPLLTIGTW